MCGRFTLRAPASAVASQFLLLDLPLWEPRFNIAPSQPAPVIRLIPQTGTGSFSASEDVPVPLRPKGTVPFSRRCRENRDSPRQFVVLHWGLIPSWASDASIGNRLINARAETVAEKPAFRPAFQRRRCLVVADGFYEWKRVDRRRQPYFIRMRDDGVLGFAGLWESWEGADHSAIESCTILTTEANDVVRPIHDRMPVIVAPADYDRWLDPAAKVADLQSLLRPFAGDPMEAYPVSTLVNSPAHEDRKCIEPAAAL